MKCIPSSFVPNINTDNKERLSKPSALEGLPDEERQTRESKRGAEGETSQRVSAWHRVIRDIQVIYRDKKSILTLSLDCATLETDNGMKEDGIWWG